MKKILYSATIAALLITSCQKTDVLNVVEDAIEFSTEIGKLTKSDDQNPNYEDSRFKTLIDQDFRVWAISDFSLGEDVKGNVYRGLKYRPVVYNPSKGWGFAATVTDKYLWPQTGYSLHFYAVSSAKDDTWLNDTENAITSKFLFVDEPVASVQFPEYTVEDNANDDVMVADHIMQHKGESKDVKPNFRHTMTKVEFNFKKGGPENDGGAAEASEIVLKSITTTALKYSGDLKVDYSSESKEKMEFAWTPKVNTKVFSKIAGTTYVTTEGVVIPSVDETGDISNPKENDYCVVNNNVYKYEKVAGSENYEWAVADEAEYRTVEGELLTDEFKNFVTWYMIPQTLDAASLVNNDNPDNKEFNGAVVTITYVADGKTITQSFDLNVSENETIKDWDEEHCVRYNVTIAPHKIIFKPTVDEWSTQGENLNN